MGEGQDQALARVADRLESRLGHRADRLDGERLPIRGSRSPVEPDLRRDDASHVARRVPLEDESLTVVEPALRGESERVGSELLERVDLEPLDEGMQLSSVLVDEEDVVVPAVLSDQVSVAVGSRGRLRAGGQGGPGEARAVAGDELIALDPRR